MTTKRKPYVRPMTSTWWKKLPFYRFYMLREGTAVPAVWFSIELIFGLFALLNGRSRIDVFRADFGAVAHESTAPYAVLAVQLRHTLLLTVVAAIFVRVEFYSNQFVVWKFLSWLFHLLPILQSKKSHFQAPPDICLIEHCSLF